MAPVKSRQQIAAEETQKAIVAAAARLFAEHGYQATSINRIADEAAVAVQTIYNSLGSKHAILSRVLDLAAAGEHAPVPVAQFMREQAEHEPDPHQIIAQLIEFWCGALHRTAPVFRIIRDAAAVDPAVAELERTRAAQRLQNYGHAAQILADRGALRANMTLDDAAATIFAIGHPETYATLCLEGSWETERWAAWATAALEGALLKP